MTGGSDPHRARAANRNARFNSKRPPCRQSSTELATTRQPRPAHRSPSLDHSTGCGSATASHLHSLVVLRGHRTKRTTPSLLTPHLPPSCHACLTGNHICCGPFPPFEGFPSSRPPDWITEHRGVEPRHTVRRRHVPRSERKTRRLAQLATTPPSPTLHGIVLRPRLLS